MCLHAAPDFDRNRVPVSVRYPAPVPVQNNRKERLPVGSAHGAFPSCSDQPGCGSRWRSCDAAVFGGGVKHWKGIQRRVQKGERVLGSSNEGHISHVFSSCMSSGRWDGAGEWRKRGDSVRKRCWNGNGRHWNRTGYILNGSRRISTEALQRSCIFRSLYPGPKQMRWGEVCSNSSPDEVTLSSFPAVLKICSFNGKMKWDYVARNSFSNQEMKKGIADWHRRRYRPHPE